MGWPESPEDDKQEHAAFSQHMCFGVPTQPVGMVVVIVCLDMAGTINTVISD